MRVRETFNTGGPTEALNMGDPMNSANDMSEHVQAVLTWSARQRLLT